MIIYWKSNKDLYTSDVFGIKMGHPVGLDKIRPKFLNSIAAIA